MLSREEGWGEVPSMAASFSSMASRMKAAMPFLPTRSVIRSRTTFGSRTCVGVMCSAGRPMVALLTDPTISGKACS